MLDAALKWQTMDWTSPYTKKVTTFLLPKKSATKRVSYTCIYRNRNRSHRVFFVFGQSKDYSNSKKYIILYVSPHLGGLAKAILLMESSISSRDII